jgi:hypothetical protein
METGLNIQQIFEEIETATEKVREVARYGLNESDILARFWSLQDNLGRLIQLVSEQPEETLKMMEEKYPSILRDAIDSISFPPKLRAREISAVSYACHDINESLIRLSYLKQVGRAGMAATV